MADVSDNLAVWQHGWDWSKGGEEWSEWWGGTPAFWHGALLPRIHAFVPTGRILEIAPGYGRWTQYLTELADELVVVDLAERCIEHCRRRFANTSNIEYHVNDGRSLDIIDDRSIDFVFSFDSLVHVEADVLDDYLSQLALKLKPDGMGFLHHSNAGRYEKLAAVARRIPEPLRRRLVDRGILLDVYAWRASVTGKGFVAQCEKSGLTCVSQERINWLAGPYLTDAISVFTPQGSCWERPLQEARNPLFREEAKRMSRLYSGAAISRSA